MAQLKVIQTFTTKDAFIIRGVLLEGQILKGMEIHLSLNDSLQVTGTITEIKKINDHFDIVIESSDQDEVELWDMLNLIGDVINIC